MKIIFSSIKNNDIFETDFAHLSSQNGTIEFKHMQGSGGIAVIYAPSISYFVGDEKVTYTKRTSGRWQPDVNKNIF